MKCKECDKEMKEIACQVTESNNTLLSCQCSNCKQVSQEDIEKELIQDYMKNKCVRNFYNRRRINFKL